VSVRSEGQGGTCVFAVTELLVFFIKKAPCSKLTVSSTSSGYPYRGFRLTGTAEGRYA
jgi:hypothetical protein